MPDEIDSILDRCLDDIAAGRETIDSCLRRYPAQAARLAVPLQVAKRAWAVPPLAPLSADKRGALESRLLWRAGQLRSKSEIRSTAPRLTVWRRGLAIVAVSFGVGILLLGSVVSASASSVPGDVFYPLKRATEQVRLTLVPEHQQIHLHLEFAQQRLQEARVLSERGEVSEDLLAEISSETALVLERVSALSPEKQAVLLTSLTNFQDQHLQILERMTVLAQGNTRAKVLAELADSTARRQQAVELLDRFVPTSVPTNKPSKELRPTDLKGETRPTQANSTAKPRLTDTAEPEVTPVATKTPHATPGKPTPKVERTPPGQSERTPKPPPQKPVKTPKK